jgi:hypothetical protein
MQFDIIQSIRKPEVVIKEPIEYDICGRKEDMIIRSKVSGRKICTDCLVDINFKLYEKLVKNGKKL